MFTVYHKALGKKELRDSVDVREHLQTGEWFNTAEEAAKGVSLSKAPTAAEAKKLNKDLVEKDKEIEQLKQKLTEAETKVKELENGNLLLLDENTLLKASTSAGK